MNEKTQSLTAIGLIIAGLILAISMFVLFLKQKGQIEEMKENAELLNVELDKKNLEYETLYLECLEKTKQLEGINQAEIEEAARVARNGRFHLGISAPTLTNAEGLELLSKLKTEGYTIWYANQKPDDLGKMYYYNNGEQKAEELKELIHGMFPNRNRFDLSVSSGGVGSGIPSEIRANTIIIKI